MAIKPTGYLHLMTVNGVSCWHDMEINPKGNKAAGVNNANDIYCQVSAALKIINIEEQRKTVSFILHLNSPSSIPSIKCEDSCEAGDFRK